MSFKLFVRSLAAALALAVTASVASAQTTQVSGKVTLKKADGTEAPVAGATVDIYRTDIKGEYHVKTDKRGQYTHAGIPFVGTYTIAVSAPGAKPTFASGLRFTQVQTQDFVLEPGDGSKLTLEQIRASAAAAPRTAAGGAAPRTESKEEKAAREAREREIAEITKKNEEITKSNEAVKNAFEGGNAALKANNVDEAIAQYQQGLAARPDEPALLTNLSEALRRRGVNRYNAALKASPPDTAGMEAAKKDWTEAAAASQKAFQLLSAAPADPAAAAGQNQNRLAAISTRALAMKLVASKVDPTQAQAAWDAYQEYVNIEADPAKKAKLKGEALQTVFDAGAMDLAVTQARAVLA